MTRVVNIAVLVLLPIVSAIRFEYQLKYRQHIFYLRSTDMGISDTCSHIFWQYAIPILLSSGARVKSVNNNITVTKKVKTMTAVLHLK